MIFIVIPVFNRKEYTRECLKSLNSQTYKNFKVIVVNDGSTDGTTEMILLEFPEVILIEGTGNLWWTASINLGIRFALNISFINKETFVLTLNNDLKVPPDYLNNMLISYNDNKPCLVGSASVNINNHEELIYCGLKNNYYLAGSTNIAKKYNYKFSKFKKYSDYIVSDSLPGRGLLIPIQIFNEIGLFDEKNFFHYMADLEFTERAKKFGYKNIISPSTVLFENFETTGMHIERLSILEFFGKFFVKTSNMYLPIRYKYAMLFSKLKLIYFFFDVIRIIMGFLRRKIRYNVNLH